MLPFSWLLHSLILVNNMGHMQLGCWISCISINEGKQCIYCTNITYLEVIQFTFINLNLMSFMCSHWLGCQI